jgi:hypothetical protein
MMWREMLTPGGGKIRMNRKFDLATHGRWGCDVTYNTYLERRLLNTARHWMRSE